VRTKGVRQVGRACTAYMWAATRDETGESSSEHSRGVARRAWASRGALRRRRRCAPRRPTAIPSDQLVQAVVDAIRENLIRPERRDDGHLVLDAADSVLAQVLLDGFDGVHLAISSVDLLRRPWERAIHVRTVRPARRGRRGKRALRSSGKAGPRSPSFLLKCGVIFDMPSTTGS
jgi:hypothetical protein